MPTAASRINPLGRIAQVDGIRCRDHRAVERLDVLVEVIILDRLVVVFIQRRQALRGPIGVADDLGVRIIVQADLIVGERGDRGVGQR